MENFWQKFDKKSQVSFIQFLLKANCLYKLSSFNRFLMLAHGYGAAKTQQTGGKIPLTLIISVRQQDPTNFSLELV